MSKQKRFEHYVKKLFYVSLPRLERIYERYIDICAETLCFRDIEINGSDFVSAYIEYFGISDSTENIYDDIFQFQFLRTSKAEIAEVVCYLKLKKIFEIE